MCRDQTALDELFGRAGALIRIHEHNIVPIMPRQQENLAHGAPALEAGRAEVGEGGVGPGLEDGREVIVTGLEFREDGVALERAGGDGDAEGTRGGDEFLGEEAEGVHVLGVFCVGGGFEGGEGEEGREDDVYGDGGVGCGKAVVVRV